MRCGTVRFRLAGQFGNKMMQIHNLATFHPGKRGPSLSTSPRFNGDLDLAGEVLVEVKAAALNRLDLWVIEGWRGLDLRFPHILGSD